MKPREKELIKGINKCEEIIKQLEINSTTTQAQINQLFKKIRIKLIEKEKELLSKLDTIEKYKKKELELQKEELKFGIESITGTCKMIENSLYLSNQSDVRLLSMRKLYHARLDYLSKNKWKIEPCHSSFIDFLMNEKEGQSLYSNISNIGIIDSDDILAEKCLISRNKNQTIYQNKEFWFDIITYTSDGNQMKKGGKSKNFTVQFEGKSKNAEFKMSDFHNGKYRVKTNMKEEGKHSIFVAYNGVELPTSPFHIQVLKFTPRVYANNRGYSQCKLTFQLQGQKYYGYHNNNGSFQGITVNMEGNIFICDNNYHRIQIFDSEGKFISTFGTNGNGDGQFNNPSGITVNSEGNILVCDKNNHRIQVFNSKGQFISKFGSQGNGNGQFQNPEGICVDLNDNIYVCDSGNNRIQIFDSEGNFISKFGSQGNGNDQFNYPIGVAVNSKGNIIVSDQNNYRIQMFNSEREYISTPSNTYGQIYVRGICVDLSDNILVCNYNNCTIHVFNSEGTFTNSFGSEVSYPTGIAVDPQTQDIIVYGNLNVAIH